MNNEPIFSPEYEIKHSTDSPSSIQQKGSNFKDKETDEFINKIESDYDLSKPRRKIIQARIIQK
jgi:hypothetical protein